MAEGSVRNSARISRAVAGASGAATTTACSAELPSLSGTVNTAASSTLVSESKRALDLLELDAMSHGS